MQRALNQSNLFSAANPKAPKLLSFWKILPTAHREGVLVG